MSKQAREPQTAPVHFVIAKGARHGEGGYPWRYELYPSESAAWRVLKALHGGHYTLKGLQEYFGYAVRPATWQERESVRFYQATYTYPVWSNESFWLNSDIPSRHYTHASLDDPGMVAFTESPEKGALDRQTRMKAGRYLTKFFGPDSDNPVLTAKRIAYLSEWQTRGARPPNEEFAKLPLKFAETADDIEAAYADGPRSCMSGSRKARCTRVYAAGDLAVAYLERPESEIDEDHNKRRVIARVLVWPAKKAMGRVYPSTDYWQHDGFDSVAESEEAQTELSNRLKAAGYTSFYEDGSIFNGARVLAEHLGDDRWVMPYIDKVGLNGDGADGYFYMSDCPDWSADDQDGVMYGPTPESFTDCDLCGIETSDDDIQHAYMQAGPTGAPLISSSVSLCPQCCADHTYECTATGYHFVDEDSGGNTHPVPVANWEGLPTNRRWNSAYFARNGFHCEYDGLNYSRGDQSTAFPGFPWRLDSDPAAHPEIAPVPTTPAPSGVAEEVAF